MHGSGFVAKRFDVVVVVVEFCCWISGSGCAVGDFDVFWPEDGEEGVVSVCAVVV
jgi:hypothetical protein